MKAGDELVAALTIPNRSNRSQMHFLKGLPHPVMAHEPFQPLRDQSLCLVSISPQPCPAWALTLPSSAHLQDDGPAGAGLALPKGDAQCLGLPQPPAVLLAGLEHTLPTHFNELLTSPCYLWLFVAPLLQCAWMTTEPSLSWKKEILNTS